jgi:hypothetical protein
VPNLFASYMRTLVPYGVALVLTATGWLGITVDSEAAAGAVSLGLGAAYYTAFRLLEELAERMAWHPLRLLAGIALGWAQPPAYGKDQPMRIRLKLDRTALQEDIDAFVNQLGTAVDGGRGGEAR